VLTWAVVGVGCWLVGNVAFVIGMVRCRDRARGHAAAHDGATCDGRAGSPDDDAAGRPSLRLAAPGRGGR
jgi:hypothetical protein